MAKPISRLRIFFLSVPYRFDDLQERLEQPEVTKSLCLIVKLLTLRLLRYTDENIGGLLLQQVMEGILPSLLKKFMLDSDKGGLSEAL